ncbi:putative NADH dehydrogenase 1 alpha subcomplex subunit 12 [Diplonema papillatum]|nr:putative NADH dehydrogenase 1 alpha subcomplex subunit 12 [Diplonema papillatum]|eukprot:gene15650-23890_t
MATATKATARRVVRDVSREYRFVADLRKEVSYKGGWRNSTQKLQWFWYGFKKYGFLANLANILRMREAWFESGEKRLVGMDALGHRYWESDEISRKQTGCHRWLDYPQHFHWAEWSKIPEQWLYWAKMAVGRSPPQLAALHKELGPAWRDFQVNSFTGGFKRHEADTFGNPCIVDGAIVGEQFTNPWDPNFKQARRLYGQGPTGRSWGNTAKGFTNLYDVDEFDPNGGAFRKLEHEGLSPDRKTQQLMVMDTDGTYSSFKRTTGPMIANNWVLRHGDMDHAQKGSEIWQDFRRTEAAKTKRSREKVSAFDIAAFSPVNEAGLHYGYQSHYKTLPVTNTANGLKNSGADERTIKDYAQVDYPQAL